MRLAGSWSIPCVYAFGPDAMTRHAQIWISGSAELMHRNLDRPAGKLLVQVTEDGSPVPGGACSCASAWTTATSSWWQDADGHWVRHRAGDEEGNPLRDVQETLVRGAEGPFG